MTIEEEIFKRSKINFNKLIEYGFQKDKDLYIFNKNILNNTFKVKILITKQSKITGKIYDLKTNEEYINYRLKDNLGSYAQKVKEKYLEILVDIKSSCFITESFIYEQTNRITKLIELKYGDKPNFEWSKFPGFATFKNPTSQKWYALIMNINKNNLDNHFNEEVEIINLKLEPTKITDLLTKQGFYQAYHMNKKNWITICLDDTLTDEEIISLVAISYNFTVKK